MDLMEKDSPFMQNLPEKLKTNIGKVLALIEDTRASKTSEEILGKMNILKDSVTSLEGLDKDVFGFFDETKDDWQRLGELIRTYTEHCHPGENLPKTKDGASEWVTQLEETASELLRIYRPLHQQINTIRQRYNKLLLETQPYLN